MYSLPLCIYILHHRQYRREKHGMGHDTRTKYSKTNGDCARKSKKLANVTYGSSLGVAVVVVVVVVVVKIGS